MTRLLYVATYLFLCLPWALFAVGWLRPVWAALTLGALALGVGFGVRSVLRQIPADDDPMGPRQWAFALLPVVAVVLLTGMGGVGFQDTDWLRGNAIFRDLVEAPWPVVYEPESGPLLLVYYTAFYLPAAAVGKWLGWQAANATLFAYGTLGLCLCALWVVRVTGLRAWWCVPLFLAFSGMDVIGYGLRTLYELANGVEMRPWRYLEWWAGYGVACYPSHIDLLVFAPKQALPAWMLTAATLCDARAGRLERTGIFHLGVSTLWAPYVSMGLLPFVLALTLPGLFRERRWRGLLSGPNALGMLLGLVAVGYFTSRLFPHVLPIDVSGLHQEHLTLTWFRRGNAFLVIYPLFVLLEFGLLHLALYGSLWGRADVIDPVLRRLLVVSTAVLTLLPWINLSWNNDIVMRASIPMLFVTLLVTARVLGDAAPAEGRRRLARLAVVAIVAVGALNAAQIASRQVRGILRQGSWVAVPEKDAVLDLFALQGFRYDEIGYNFVGQYMGSVESPFARYLMASHPAAAAGVRGSDAEAPRAPRP